LEKNGLDRVLTGDERISKLASPVGGKGLRNSGKKGKGDSRETARTKKHDSDRKGLQTGPQ